MAQVGARRRMAALAAGVAAVVLAAPASAQVVIVPDVAPKFAAPCGGVALFGALLPATLTVAAFDVNPADAVTIETGDLPAWATFTSEPGNPAKAQIAGAPTILDFVVQSFTPLPAIELGAFDAAGNGTGCTIIPLISLL